MDEDTTMKYEEQVQEHHEVTESFIRFFQVETTTKYKPLFLINSKESLLIKINILDQNSVYRREKGQHKCLSSSGPNLQLLIHNETSRSEVQ